MLALGRSAETKSRSRCVPRTLCWHDLSSDCARPRHSPSPTRMNHHPSSFSSASSCGTPLG